MHPPTVDHLTGIRRWGARLTAAERHALLVVTIAWGAGALLESGGWHEAPARWAHRRLAGELPSPAALAERLPPGDPRPTWYAAGLALRRERERAASGPARIDPNTADRADWDRLAGIGPRTAEAILAVRGERGGFAKPEDLLEVRGIGPKTLERIRPWLVWPGGTAEDDPPPEGSSGDRTPPSDPRKDDLNRVDLDFLATLPNIGPQLAATILRERGRRGGFRDWTDVEAIEGIGPSRLAVLQNATRLPNPHPTGGTTKSEDP
ncbi:MAG: helix-hairpin-helix domain-containing protein [Gemmatimonadetes bacterium]|nr:helix-hairpin-helix domain-containing protein [Gemmatimonadota bacterium]